MVAGIVVAAGSWQFHVLLSNRGIDGNRPMVVWRAGKNLVKFRKAGELRHLDSCRSDNLRLASQAHAGLQFRFAQQSPLRRGWLLGPLANDHAALATNALAAAWRIEDDPGIGQRFHHRHALVRADRLSRGMQPEGNRNVTHAGSPRWRLILPGANRGIS